MSLITLNINQLNNNLTNFTVKFFLKNNNSLCD